MLHRNAVVLFESTDANAVLTDPANQDWLAVVGHISGEIYQLVALRYYLALHDLRRRARRAPLPGRREVRAETRQQAFQCVLAGLVERTASEKATSGRDETAIFVEARPDPDDNELPEALRDFSKPPPPLSNILGGRGRPPCDALCLMRAFVAAPLLGIDDSPTAVHRLLHSNPTYARACDFCGPTAMRQPGEFPLCQRRLPSLSMCEEFSEVMIRYGLWQLVRFEQVRENVLV